MKKTKLIVLIEERGATILPMKVGAITVKSTSPLAEIAILVIKGVVQSGLYAGQWYSIRKGYASQTVPEHSSRRQFENPFPSRVWACPVQVL